MRKIVFLPVLLFFLSAARSQPPTPNPGSPKIVVGIMVDQMRWDFLYRYAARYGNMGFRRLMNSGFSCENTFIDYAQTVTACGHASVYTGSVPAIHGIMGNEWYDRNRRRMVYCTEDPSVKTIGGASDAAPMSPRNLVTTTMCDQLRVSNQFKSKVIGIAIKDRGGILPAGHTANAAYWYDARSGNWVSSTYYMPLLPDWVNRFNSRKLPDSLYKLEWNTLYPISTYTSSDEDDRPYKGKFEGEDRPVFPHRISGFAGRNYGVISATPHGNTLTLEFAKQAVINEGLGADEFTDFLAVSLSSPDYIGHQFGPNSIEVEDCYLRLDRELGDFLKFLDSKFGSNYTVFLTADHGVANAPGYEAQYRLPGGTLNPSTSMAVKNTAAKYKINVVENFSNYHVYLNKRAIDSIGADLEDVKEYLIGQLNAEPAVHYAFDYDDMDEARLPREVKEKFINGLHPKLSGDIGVILKPGYLTWGGTGSSHGSWYPYDAHIPFVMMGWGVNKGKLYRQVGMKDIAPTICSLLKIEVPSGSIGQAVAEAIK